MQDRILATDTALHAARRSRRLRALGACTALAVALHLAFLDSIVGAAMGSPELAMTPVSVRTIEVDVEPATEQAVVLPPTAPVATATSPPAVAPVPTPMPLPQPRRRAPEPARAPATSPAAAKASASSTEPPLAASLTAQLPPFASEQAASAALLAGERDSAASGARQSAFAGAAAASAPIAFPGAGDEPPPVYRTQLPPAATLHYEVRRGLLRGDGEIRWQPGLGRYRLVLEARIAGVTLLLQTSEGAIDGDGLAPVRFLDQRARRPAQAANFVRDAGRITFSGTALEWPLPAGSQDRLSWMIQLAAIAAAQPELLTEGGRITMAVVGARGDASIWTLRCVGMETVETANGPVRAVKLAREARSAYDTNAEIWLDPERSYLPARATLRNSAGVSEYELLLDRIGP